MFDKFISVRESPDIVQVTKNIKLPVSIDSTKFLHTLCEEMEEKIIGMIDIGVSEKSHIPKGTIIISLDQKNGLTTSLNFCFNINLFRIIKRKQYRTLQFQKMSKQDIFNEYLKAFCESLANYYSREFYGEVVNCLWKYKKGRDA